MYYRHGDVLFERIGFVSSDDRRTTTEEEKAGVVQRGESTGHAHVIEDMAGIALFSVSSQRFGTERFVTHEEISRSHMRNTNR